MKRMKYYIGLLLVAATMFGCGDDYDDTALKNELSDLKARVEKLESWCSTANTQISALQGLVGALEQNDCITGVTPIMEGSKEVGYTITFSKGNPITILNGKDGVAGITPIIGAKKDTDGLYYWTIQVGDAEPAWMTDAEGNKVRTTGDKGDKGDDGLPGSGTEGHSPVLSVDTFEGKLYWKVDGEWLLHNGAKVPATGDKGDAGDAIFKKDGIDTSHDTYVEFTLADGETKIKLARSTDVTISIKDVKDEMTVKSSEKTTGKTAELVLPAIDKYKAITAEITSKGGTETDIATRASQQPWTVKITKPVVDDKGVVTTPGSITVTPGNDVQEGDQAILKLVIIDNKNIEHKTIILITYTDKVSVTGVTISKSTLALGIGQKETLTATVAPADATKKDVEWSSSDATTATVSATGEVTGVKEGTAIITVTTVDGKKSATCTVTVSPIAVTGISLNKTTLSLAAKASETLIPTITPANATNKVVTWTSSDPTIATVEADGKVTGVKEGGPVTITATTQDGQKSATCQVTVTKEVTGYAWYAQGKPSGKFEISNARELREFAKLVNGDAEALSINGEMNAVNFSGKSVKIADSVSEIDLNNEEWTPIGNSNSVAFKGVFDGNNKGIKNIKLTTGQSYMGLFGRIDGATVQNVILQSGTIEGGRTTSGRVSSIVAEARVNCKIIRCVNRVNVTGYMGNTSYVGGIVAAVHPGYSGTSTVIACENYGRVMGADHTGGIVGSCNNARVIACINHGAVETTEATTNAGGIAGISTSDGDYFATCLSVGNVTAPQYAGGIVGTMRATASTLQNQFVNNYFMGGDASLKAVASGISDQRASTDTEINAAVPQLNTSIRKWNNDNSDVVCSYHYEAVTGNLPQLVAGAPEL